jgi:hypothetical protein
LNVDLSPPSKNVGGSRSAAKGEVAEDVEVPRLFRSLGRALGKGVGDAISDGPRSDVERSDAEP